jgi:hypothetical protein
MDEVLELEKAGWQALSTGGDAGKRFYERVLRDDAVMLFPGGMRIVGKDQILDSLGTQPWASFEIQDPDLIELSPHARALVYRVIARREGSPLYEALITSIYTSDGGLWKLILHQQTQA